ncbi:MAG: protein-tyrosine-phosphatase [Myxococcota bacterium]
MTTPQPPPAPDLEDLHPPLAAYVEKRWSEVDAIPDERRAALDKLAGWVRRSVGASESASLTFICTHNSRRSHMTQLWAQTAAAVMGVPGIKTFSGGTEATAFNPRAVAAMTRAGFDIERPDDADNPHYAVGYGPSSPRMEAFSKVFGHEANPKEGFVAVMTCSQADASCPFVPGAAYRVSLPYEDPKASDGTEREAGAYDARVAQVATEMLYVFSRAVPSGDRHGSERSNP